MNNPGGQGIELRESLLLREGERECKGRRLATQPKSAQGLGQPRKVMVGKVHPDGPGTLSCAA
ncbi:hypothetical protein FOIG_09278 [Fusarium odoratissimum NRRL 54006]|uniref:Uncharacterized protein n=2 Tax=Fusarium oxysporum species complex TaxID=171631 RepID=X0KNV7_FUSO5|nr:uncharacterized protein FOIG_09278 [Fusarium odoratissimum NRRL 54006]EXL98504.1 hypothetical protein FOIG_09278 [Fusarium odoratissimum NRRL 54006]TXC00823.1 hypothetical protein FocTR4_00008223 [Fusarium oxysporum f. sp. cubense]